MRGRFFVLVRNRDLRRAKKIHSQTTATSDNSSSSKTTTWRRVWRISKTGSNVVDVPYDEEGTHREMLEQPRPEDVGRDLGEDSSLLLVLLARRIIVLLASALATTDTRVTRVTCNNKERARGHHAPPW